MTQPASALRVSFTLLLLASASSACADQAPAAAKSSPLPCSSGWYEHAEARVVTGDGQGHGPDIGSDEWQSVVEFRLGVRGNPDVPARGSEAWCEYIDQKISKMPAAGHASSTTKPSGAPSFDCTGVESGSIEALICTEPELATMDRQLAEVYAAASARATDEYPPMLRAGQRGWIKGRDDCWKSENVPQCVKDEYTRRIAELQATYRLVPSRGPFRFFCSDNPADEVVVTYFATTPGTLLAERGDGVSLMYEERSASGARYQGRNESFWEHQGEARIQWGYDAPEMRCKRDTK